jgi:hypothetical protein
MITLVNVSWTCVREHACVYTCVRIYMRAYTCVRIYACVNMRACICVREHACIYMRVRLYACALVHLCVSVCVHVCVRACTCVDGRHGLRYGSPEYTTAFNATMSGVEMRVGREDALERAREQEQEREQHAAWLRAQQQNKKEHNQHNQHNHQQHNQQQHNRHHLLEQSMLRDLNSNHSGGQSEPEAHAQSEVPAPVPAPAPLAVEPSHIPLARLSSASTPRSSRLLLFSPPSARGSSSAGAGAGTGARRENDDHANGPMWTAL